MTDLAAVSIATETDQYREERDLFFRLANLSDVPDCPDDDGHACCDWCDLTYDADELLFVDNGWRTWDVCPDCYANPPVKEV